MSHRSASAACAILLTLASSPAPARAVQSPPQASTFKGWQSETFGPVGVERGNGLTLSSSAGPGGMFFRRALVKDASYRLTIVGQSRSGKATVRLTLGKSKPQWLPAPDGQTVVAFTGSPSVEVVVYSDTPYAYHLQNLQLDACEHCTLPSVFRGWKLEPYGVVQWTSNTGSVSLSSETGASGVFFRSRLDPAKTYRLRLAGKARSGITTVRVTTGRSEPRWFPAPNGRKQLTVSASDSIEAVIYGDAAYSYRLEALTIEECSSCLTDGQFAGFVAGEIPQLQSLLKRDRQAAARALLNWTAHVVDVGLGDVEPATSLEHEMGAAQAYQDLWSANVAGTSCAGFADFFAKVLRLFGFDAFTVHIGYAGTPLTHVTTVVLIDEAFHVLDPTFNGVYVDSASGDLARLEQLLKAPIGGDDFAFQISPVSRDVVFESPTLLRMTLDVDIADCETVRDQATDGVRYVCPRVPFDARSIQARWKEGLEELHLLWDHDTIRSLLRHQVLAMSDTAPAIRRRFLDALSSLGIPFGVP